MCSNNQITSNNPLCCEQKDYSHTMFPVFLGNGVMAIASSLLGNFLVEDLRLGPVAPFDAIAAMLLGGL
jgi:hypothetical protein